MDLGERKLKILASVVENYVLTGEPVSSKTICDNLDISVSSATVRNEMASLTSLGILEQPHTSSGRIPSYLGYRVYVNRVMDKKPMSVSEQKTIDDALLSSAKDPDSLLKDASSVLADITKCAVASVMPSQEDVTIRSVQLMKISLRSAMVILVTSSGIIKNRVFCCDYDLNRKLIDVFQNVLTQKFTDVSIENFTPAFIQTTAASLGELAIMASPMLMAVFEAVKDINSVGVNLEGKLNLLFVPEFKGKTVRDILDFLDSDESVADLLLHNNNRSMQILIGQEIKIRELNDLSVIISRYNISNRNAGAIGIIGSTRMDYARFMSSLEYISNVLEKILGDILS